MPPAHLVLSDPQPGEPTIAGGTGSVTLTATNDGGETSQPTPITVTTPPGIAVSRIDTAVINTALIDPALITPRSTDSRRARPSDRVPCQLPTITAGQSVQLTVALTARPQAKDGPLTVSAAGDHRVPQPPGRAVRRDLDRRHARRSVRPGFDDRAHSHRADDRGNPRSDHADPGQG